MIFLPFLLFFGAKFFSQEDSNWSNHIHTDILKEEKGTLQLKVAENYCKFNLCHMSHSLRKGLRNEW